METIVQALNKAMKSGTFDLDEADAILKALVALGKKLRESEGPQEDISKKLQ